MKVRWLVLLWCFPGEWSTHSYGVAMRDKKKSSNEYAKISEVIRVDAVFLLGTGATV
jgi:hypothetical protein